MWYKIVEKHPNGLKTVLHGHNGSRLLKVGVWLKANERMVTDNSRSKRYLSGWHVLENYEGAVKFLNQKFRKRKELLHVVSCRAKDLRVKPSNSIVFLAKWIKINDEIL